MLMQNIEFSSLSYTLLQFLELKQVTYIGSLRLDITAAPLTQIKLHFQFPDSTHYSNSLHLKKNNSFHLPEIGQIISVKLSMLGFAGLGYAGLCGWHEIYSAF